MWTMRVAMSVALLLGAVAGHGHHTCPYLAKMMPKGEDQIDHAQHLLKLRHTDCDGFAQQFSETGEFTWVCGRTGKKHTVSTREEVQEKCERWKFLDFSLKSVFPDFSTNSTMFQADDAQRHMDSDWHMEMLWEIHVCPKTKKITSYKIVGQPTTKAALMDVAPPKELVDVGRNFVESILVKGNCDAYADLATEGVTVHSLGEPSEILEWKHGSGLSADGAQKAAAACKEKAARDARFTTKASMTVTGQFFNAADNELTLLVDKDYSVVFAPGQTHKSPMAAILRFDVAGKIEAVRFYNTEVLHLEDKFSSKYGHKSVHAPEAVKSDRFATVSDQPAPMAPAKLTYFGFSAEILVV